MTSFPHLPNLELAFLKNIFSNIATATADKHKILMFL